MKVEILREGTKLTRRHGGHGVGDEAEKFGKLEAEILRLTRRRGGAFWTGLTRLEAEIFKAGRKYNFADKGIPKCNSGTRDGRGRKSRKT